jgi:tetratricopeptide (TPR) repeat protein
LVPIALVCFACACRANGGSSTAGETGSAELRAVDLPDITALGQPVQRQLRQRFESLSQKLAGRAPQAELADAYGDLGRLLLAAKLGAAAGLSFQHAQALMPRDARWPYYLGHVALSAGDHPAAIAAFQRAVTLAPADLPSLVWLAEANLDDGRAAEAESLFLNAAALHPKSAAALFGSGRAALARQSYRDAVGRFEAALAIDGHASAIHYPLAMAYRGINDPQNAEAHLRQRGDEWPGFPDPLMDGQRDLLESVTVYERRGVEALAARDWPAAAAAFRKGLELSPDDPALRDRLAGALYQAGDRAGATRELDEVIRRSPEFVKAHVSLGTISTLAGRYPEAIERFAAALKLDANSVDARLGLAEALRVSGRSEEAMPHYARAVKLDPTIAEAWVGGTMALISLKRYPRAREWLAEARRVHPDQSKLAELEALLVARPF